YAGLAEDVEPTEVQVPTEERDEPARPMPPPASVRNDPFAGVLPSVGPKPLSERLEITMNGRTLAGTFTLISSDEVDTVIKILEANRGVLKALEEVVKG